MDVPMDTPMRKAGMLFRMNTPPHRPGITAELIGAPTDIGAGTRGASMGPEALRVAGLRSALEFVRRSAYSAGQPLIDRNRTDGRQDQPLSVPATGSALLGDWG